MNIGLENLRMANCTAMSTEEFLDTAVTLFSQLDSMADTASYIDLINERIVMMEELRTTINKHGYTKSLESLFGSNFEYGYSHEGLGEKISNAWKTFVAWCKKVWQRIKDVFALFFNNADKMISKLEERKKAIDQNGLKNENTKVTIPGVTMIKQVLQVLSRDLITDLQRSKKIIDELKQKIADGTFGDIIPEKYGFFKPIIEKYADLYVAGGGAVFDATENAGPEDDVTLTKSVAISFINTIIEVLKSLKSVKKYVEELHKNINELLDATAKEFDKTIVNTAADLGKAVLNSPTGRELIGMISKWCAGVISKGTKLAIVVGARLLSKTTPASK